MGKRKKKREASTDSERAEVVSVLVLDSDADYTVGRTLPPDLTFVVFKPESERRLRESPLVGWDEARMPIRAMLGLREVAEGHCPWFQTTPLLGAWSWFGGRPLSVAGAHEEWPLDHAGLPIPLVVQVDLANLSDDMGGDGVLDPVGLPPEGLLQVYCDPSGLADADPDPSAWLVRMVPREVEADAAGFEFLSPPDGHAVPGIGTAVQTNVMIFPSIPSPEVFVAESEEERARYHLVYDHIEEYPHLTNMGKRPDREVAWSPWDPEFERHERVCRINGFPAFPVTDDQQAVLDQRLPLQDGDEHVLLLEFNPDQSPRLSVLTDRAWQMWIRASDLAELRFDETWCLTQ